MSQGRLHNRVAIITGAASGMGLVTAHLFAEEGATVVGVDLPGKEREAAVARVAGPGGQARFVAADVTKFAAVAALVADVLGKEGRIDVLFNNAGYNLMKTLEDTSEEEFDACLDVNLRAVFLLCRAVIPVMRDQGGGSILSTASSAAVAGRGFLPVYSAAKAAVVILTKSLAVAHGPDGIRVNCLVPGSIYTPMFVEALGDDIDGSVRDVEAAIPLRRIGTGEDIARAALFLASEEAAYVTGVALPVDGGRTATVQEPSKGFGR